MDQNLAAETQGSVLLCKSTCTRRIVQVLPQSDQREVATGRSRRQYGAAAQIQGFQSIRCELEPDGPRDVPVPRGNCEQRCDSRAGDDHALAGGVRLSGLQRWDE